MLKIVLDTNALIDASSDYYHYANRIIDSVISGNIKAYANRGTLRENNLLAARKISDEGYLKKLEYFFAIVLPVESPDQLEVIDEDPQDNKILESAVAAGADYLVTSDRHLLKLEKYKGVRMVTPRQFWNIYEDESESGWHKWLKNFIG